MKVSGIKVPMIGDQVLGVRMKAFCRLEKANVAHDAFERSNVLRKRAASSRRFRLIPRIWDSGGKLINSAKLGFETLGVGAVGEAGK